MSAERNNTGRANKLVLAFVFAGIVFDTSTVHATEPAAHEHRDNLSGYQSAIGRIATAIERLKPEYPQLLNFSARVHCERERLTITYGYRTHPATHSGGWTSGVPNPDATGVWFYIDFHDPDSQAQIHTQPVVPRFRYKDKNVMFLILEGQETTSLSAAIFRIFRNNGVR